MFDFHAELSRALAENGWVLEGHTMQPSTSQTEASAEIELMRQSDLPEPVITVTLSSSGYAVRYSPSCTESII